MNSELEGLIRTYRAARNEAETEALNRKILQKYNVTATLMVLDMSGFSRITEAHGIVHFLAMVHQMQEIASAELQRFNGHVIKFFSDNCFAYFEHTQDAVECARGIMAALKKVNETRQQPLHICIGIDYGEFLLIESRECFGHTVNRACKLGEDIAEGGDLLVSDRAVKQLKAPEQFSIQARTFEESGLRIEAWELA